MFVRSFVLTLVLALLPCSLVVAQEGVTLKVGDKAPDFAVETFDNKTITLSERFGDEGKNTVLLFSRANW